MSDTLQNPEDELIPVSEAPDLNKETESLGSHESKSDIDTLPCPADAFPEAEEQIVPVSETPELDTETEDFLSMDYESDVDVSTFPYGKEDILCLRCWLQFCHLQRGECNGAPDTLCSDSSSDLDPLSEHEYSPFLFHS